MTMDELTTELKSKRESLGLSVQDLFQRTRINTEFLEALEAGNFDVLPEAYVKLFLKRYAQEVKLDGDEIVKRFEQQQWKQKAATESIQRPESEGTPGWVIGAGGALAIALVAAVVVWQSTPTTTSLPPAPTVPPQTASVRSESAAPREGASVPNQVTSRPARQPDTPITTPAIEPDPAPVSSTPVEEAPAEVAASTSDPDPIEPETTVGTEPAPSQASEPLQTTAEVESTDRATEPPVTDPSPELEDASQNERVVSAYSISLRQDLSSSTGDLSLTAVGLEPTDVVVTSDGEPVYQGLIDAGRRVSWKANDRFSIEVQKGSGLQLQLQDEILPVVGAEGRQVRLYISRFSIWVEEIESPNATPPDAATP